MSFHFKFNIIFSVLLLSLFSVNIAFSGGTKTITAFTPVTLNWNVGNAAGCSPSTSYPAGDGVASTWTSSNKSSAGSQALGSPTVPGTFTFSCSSYSPGGANDSSTLVVNPAPCSSPWGTVSHGYSNTAYQTTPVTYPTTCASVSQTRTCTNGTLSGSYTNPSCSYTTPALSSSVTPSSPAYVSYGGGFSSLSYTVSGASSCTGSINGGTPWATDSSTGTHYLTSGNYYSNTTWTFVCYNPNGTSVSSSVTLQVCSPGYNAVGGVCTNPLPTVTISPAGTYYLALGQAFDLSSLATDASNDISIHNLTWEKPNGEDRYAGTSQWGTVTYTGPTTFSTVGTGNSNLGAAFKPDHLGTYRVRFAVQDNSFVNGGSNSRWTYSDWVTIKVVNETVCSIMPDPTDITKLKWQVFNANQATLVTTNGPTTYDFTNRPIPPNSGQIIPTVGATYTLTCRNTVDGQLKVAVYSTPSLTVSSLTATSATINWNCNNTNAKSVLIERIPGTSTVYSSTNSSRTDTDLTGGTEYKYTLRCFDQLAGGGNQIGVATLSFFTLSNANFTLSAYIRATSGDSPTYISTQPYIVQTGNGQFYDWSYRVTNGTASSCTMQQRDDGGAWYPTNPYVTNESQYTMLWNGTAVPPSIGTLSSSDRTNFVNSFSTQHDWKLICLDNTGASGALLWSLRKIEGPEAVYATLDLNCPSNDATNPTISLQCSTSDYYEIKNNAGSIIASGASTPVTVQLGGSNDTYKIICKLGGANGTASREVTRSYSSSMCDTQATSFIASPFTVRSGGATTLLWNILNPTNACTISASAVCTGNCDQTRTDAANALNAKLSGASVENTDANDPYSLSPDMPRTITKAIREEAPVNGLPGHALGKKTLQVNYTTDFKIQCGSSEQKVRVNVSNENEG